MNTNCTEIQERLSALIDGELESGLCLERESVVAYLRDVRNDDATVRRHPSW